MFSLVTFLVGVYVGQEYPNFPNVKNSLTNIHNYWQSSSNTGSENRNEQNDNTNNNTSNNSSFDLNKVLELIFGKKND